VVDVVAMHSRDLHRYTVDGVGRIYTNGEDLWLPSVSTVLGMRETPEALQNWKERQKSNGTYNSTMHFKQDRGTLIHEATLSQLVPEDPDTGKPIKRIWGEEERNAATRLRVNGRLESDYMPDERWALSSWDILSTVVNFDQVIDVETNVINTDVGYAGQFDLLYQDFERDETVLADVKTSRACYEKHLLQLSAYKNAVPLSIDRMEVLRLNPDQRDWEVFESHDWDEDEDDLFAEFCRLRGELEQQKLHTIIDTIQDSSVEEEGVVREEM